MEDCMEIPLKTRNRTTIWPSNPTTGHIPWENHKCKRFLYLSVAALFTIPRRRQWHPLQYSCLENPMDWGAWKAAVHGVARVGHDWATSLSLFTFMHWRRKWQPTPVFLPGESQGQEAWWAAVYGVAQSRTRLKQRSSSSRTWKHLDVHWQMNGYRNCGAYIKWNVTQLYKRMHWVSPNEVDEPRGYCTEWSKSERERQMLYNNVCV